MFQHTHLPRSLAALWFQAASSTLTSLVHRPRHGFRLPYPHSSLSFIDRAMVSGCHIHDAVGPRVHHAARARHLLDTILKPCLPHLCYWRVLLGTFRTPYWTLPYHTFVFEGHCQVTRWGCCSKYRGTGTCWRYQLILCWPYHSINCYCAVPTMLSLMLRSPIMLLLMLRWPHHAINWCCAGPIMLPTDTVLPLSCYQLILCRPYHTITDTVLPLSCYHWYCAALIMLPTDTVLPLSYY